MATRTGKHLPNSTFFSNILQSCIHWKSLRAVQQTHAHLLKTQFSSEIFILNRLIDSYAKCGFFLYARNLFDGMPQRNIFSYNSMLTALTKSGRLEDAVVLFRSMPDHDQCSWNSMVSGFSQHGHFEESLEFFSIMHGEDFVLNAYSFSSALSSCAGIMNLRTGMQIHALVSKSRLSHDVYMGTALLDMYSKCKRPLEAYRVFEMMKERNTATWNSLITCHEQNGPANEALVLFVRMMDCGVEFDEVTLASVASACATLSAIREGLQIHAQAIKFERFSNDLVLSNALVDMYAKCSRIEVARKIFDCMPVRSTVAETSMISGYAKSSSVEDAKLVFSRMTEKNIIAWNALIAGYTQNGDDEEAVRLFQRLKRESVWPTHYTFGNILNASANLSDLQLGKQAHCHVLKHGFRFEAGPEPDIFVGNALVDMYLKCGSVDEGGKVFERMIGKDRVSWNAMIVGYAQNGCGEETLHLFQRMLSSGETPDHVTMIGVLSGCSHAGLVDDGRRYFQSMTREFGLVPCRDHYTCMVDLLGRAGHLAEVEAFIKEIPVAPDSVLWASLLAACRAHGNVKLGEWAAEMLFELDPTSSGPYVLLSNMYAEIGEWEDVRRIRKLMKNKGVIKQPGCSWIEIEQKVHVFMVRDRRHARRKSIYNILKILQTQMKRSSMENFVGMNLSYCS
ncbi:putative tetratricopeptide-like helical domain superfamily [Dioscorea sansibarensis]